tara:strand:- start:686 stop:1981 length:1296 start_codon:yes stop_codon:yes gene_type:complete
MSNRARIRQKELKKQQENSKNNNKSSNFFGTKVIQGRKPGSERRTDYKETDVSIDRQVDNYVKDRNIPGGPKKIDATPYQPPKPNKNDGSYSSSPIFNIKRPIFARGGILRYPLEAMTDSTDYLQIDIGKYIPVKTNNNTFATLPGNRRAKRKSDVPGGLSNHSLVNKGTVLLQIPANIQDGNSTSYGDSKMNTIVGTAVGAVADGMEELGGILGNELSSEDKEKYKSRMGKASAVGSDRVMGALEASGVGSFAKDFINKKLATSIVGSFGGNVTVNQLLARESGQIFNPNMELLFNGPSLRNFRFSFKMMPRSRDEAEQIRLIIRTFKMNMAPKVTTTTSVGTTLFLDTPSVFELRYKSGRRNHPFLHKFKQCFLTDISVNYTAEGVYATYENKEPIAMIMDLTFKELEPIYDIDYLDDSGSDRDNTVGY